MLNFSISFLYSSIFSFGFIIVFFNISFKCSFFFFNSIISSFNFFFSSSSFDEFIKSRNAFDLNFYYIKNIIYILNNVLIIITYTFLNIKLIKNKITEHLKK